MLDHDHPQTPYIFQASGLIDGVMLCAQRMTVSPSAVRAELLAECLPLFEEMRELALAQFADRAAFILEAVAQYEVGVRAVAALGGGHVTKEACDDAKDCPVCGAALMRIGDDRRALCGECGKLYMTAKLKLANGRRGFGTDAI
jgi:hypothetical protein